MIFSRVAAGILTAFAVCSAAEVPEYFRKGIAGVFPEAKQFREIREKEFAVEDGAGKLLGRLFLESIDDTERRFGYAGTVEVALLFDAEEHVAGVLIGKNVETRRYLNRIRRAKFLERWNGLSMEELPGKEVDAVTGATLSCDAISHGVRRLAERCLKRISEERVAAENRSEQVRLTRRIASLKKDLEEGKARDVQPRKGNEVELRLIAAVQGADAAKAFAAKHGLRFFAHMVPRPPKRTGNRPLSGPDAALAAYRKEPSEQNLVALRAAILSDYEFHLGLRNRDNARALKNVEERLRVLQSAEK